MTQITLIQNLPLFQIGFYLCHPRYPRLIARTHPVLTHLLDNLFQLFWHFWNWDSRYLHLAVAVLL